MAFNETLLREILQDAGEEQPIHVERTRAGAAPLKENRRRAVIVGARITAVDQRADFANAGVPPVGGERTELRVHLVCALCVVPARGQHDGRLAEIERAVEL